MANDIESLLSFLANPLHITFLKPNWHLMILNGGSTFARVLALIYSVWIGCLFFLGFLF
jgi:hypothetical protein